MTDSDPTPTGDTTDRYLDWDASYVLGALSPGERREFGAHLLTCARCSTSVAELTGMPAVLSMIDVHDVEALDTEPAEPPLSPALREQLVDRVRRRRERNRWVTAAALGVAAALLILGLVAVVTPGTLGLQKNSQQTVAMLEMSKVNDTPINASVAMSSYTWGTRIDMACSYGDWGQRDAPAQNLGMVVVGRDGSRAQIATWLGLSGATALPSANTAMAAHEIAAVQLVSADDGKVLLEKNL